MPQKIVKAGLEEYLKSLKLYLITLTWMIIGSYEQTKFIYHSYKCGPSMNDIIDFNKNYEVFDHRKFKTLFIDPKTNMVYLRPLHDVTLCSISNIRYISQNTKVFYE